MSTPPDDAAPADDAPDPLARVREAIAAVAAADRGLHEAVRAARGDGVTWAALGEVLGTTRQAAFKRFGAPRDPRTGDPMTARPTTELVATAERAFALLDAGDHDALAALLTPAAAEVLTREVLLDTWASAVAVTGNLVRCRDSVPTAPDGGALEGDRVLGGAVVATTLECEAGEWMGRVALDLDGRIAGLLVVPPGTTDLPW